MLKKIPLDLGLFLWGIVVIICVFGGLQPRAFMALFHIGTLQTQRNPLHPRCGMPFLVPLRPEVHPTHTTRPPLSSPFPPLFLSPPLPLLLPPGAASGPKILTATGPKCDPGIGQVGSVMGRTFIIGMDGRSAVCKTRGASRSLPSAGSRFLWQRVLNQVFCGGHLSPLQFQ